MLSRLVRYPETHATVCCALHACVRGQVCVTSCGPALFVLPIGSTCNAVMQTPHNHWRAAHLWLPAALWLFPDR
jgi:hypothetical protein